MPFLRCFFVFVLFAFVADAAELEILSVRVGIEGFYKNGLWTPVVVEYRAPEKKIEDGSVGIVIESADADGTPIIYTSDAHRTVRLEKEGVFRSTVYAKLGRKNKVISVTPIGAIVNRSYQPSGNPAKQPKPAEAIRFYEPVPSERPIYLIVGKEDIGLQGAIAELALREERRPLLVKVASFKDLPNEWFGFEAVDTIVLTTTEPEQFDGLTAKSPQIKAIDAWLKLGGRLLFCAGKDSETLLEEKNGIAGPLTPFLPGKFSKMTELRLGTPLELFVGSKRPIFMNGTDDAPFLKMPGFTEPRGIGFVKDVDLPLVSRCARGLGTIVYFGGDLSGKPLAAWRDRTALVRNIMQWNTDRTVGSHGNASLIQLGYNDISGQVRSALDRFDKVRVVPFSLLLLILAAYWLVVGPLDWFVVHKVLKKPVWTWVTFPFWIVLFSGLAYYLAAPGRPNEVFLNELNLVDMDEETHVLRSSVWTNLYSPGDSTYSLSLAPIAPAELKRGCLPSCFSWNGLPGSGLGGMAPKTVSPTVWQIASRQINEGCIENVPVQVRSTKSFFGQSWALEDQAARFVDFGFKSTLADEEGVPIGQIELGKSMPPLNDCVLVYDRWALNLGTVEPGQTIRVGKTTPRRELRDLLISKDVLDNDALRRLASYNTQSTNLPYVARVMSLYGLLGGFETVGLYHSFQRSLDLSDLFSTDRAVLIGQAHDPCPEEFGSGVWGLGGKHEKRRTVVFRQSLPIKLGPLSPRLGIERREIKDDKLKDVDKSIQGPGEYKLDQPKRQ